jgi:hypothetical protein
VETVLNEPVTQKKVLYRGGVPDPDYENHPAYGRFFPRASLADQILALRKFWPHFKKQLKAGQKCTWDRLAATAELAKAARSPLARQLAVDGVLGLTTPSSLGEELKLLTQPYIDTLQAHRHSKQIGEREFMDNIHRIPREDAVYYDTMTRLLTEMGILDAASEYLGVPVSVHTINLQIGDADDQWMRQPFEDVDLPPSPLLYMHQDSIYHMLKCIWYLTPVTEEDGPFHFVLGSHRVAMGKLEYAIRSAQDSFNREGPNRTEVRRQFWALPAFFRKKAHFGDDVLASNPAVPAILDSEYRFTSNDGDMVLFDVKGFHRGSIFKSGSRINVQVMLLPCATDQ